MAFVFVICTTAARQCNGVIMYLLAWEEKCLFFLSFFSFFFRYEYKLALRPIYESCVLDSMYIKLISQRGFLVSF